MGVIHGVCWPWQASSGCSTPLLDVEAVCLFMRAQSSWLRRGLRHADDPTAVGIVLGAHDASHESWLGLIAAIERIVGPEPAAELAALYGFHGRVVGCLEQGVDRRVPHEVADAMREGLAERLAELTEAAIDAVRRATGESTARPAFQLLSG